MVLILRSYAYTFDLTYDSGTLSILKCDNIKSESKQKR